MFELPAGKRKNKRINGKIFCQVDNIRHMGQFRADITVLYQLWKGAMPSFINSADTRGSGNKEYASG